MYKSLVLVAGLTASLSAFAMPKVGDQSVLDVTISQGAQSISGTITNEVTKFDAAAKVYTVHREVKIQGQPDDVEDAATSEDEMVTDDMVNDMLANCAARGGVTEQVTVPAGIFPSCALNLEAEEGIKAKKVWVAKVPFGVAKMVTERADGVTITVALRSFK